MKEFLQLEPRIINQSYILDIPEHISTMEELGLKMTEHVNDLKEISSDFANHSLSLQGQEEIIAKTFKEVGSDVAELIQGGGGGENVSSLTEVNSLFQVMKEIYNQNLESFYESIQDNVGLDRGEYDILAAKPVGEFLAQPAGEGLQYSKEALSLRNFLNSLPADDLAKAADNTIDELFKSKFNGAIPSLELGALENLGADDAIHSAVSESFLIFSGVDPACSPGCNRLLSL